MDDNPVVDDTAAVFVISVAAELAGMHPQTLRQYDRLGLVTPSRARGRGRRYSPRDVTMLREVQRLSQQEGVNLAGVKRIMELEREVERLRTALARAERQREEARVVAQQARRVFAAGRGGEIVRLDPGERPAGPAGALVLWDPLFRRGR